MQVEPIVYGDPVPRHDPPQPLFSKSAPVTTTSNTIPESQIQIVVNPSEPHKDFFAVGKGYSKKAHRGVAKATVAMWILNLLVLGLLISIILVESTNYFSIIEREDGRTIERIQFDTRLGLCIPFSILYIIYVIACCASKLRKYSSNIEKIEESIASFTTMAQSKAIVNYRVECWHHETRHSSHTDSHGHTHHQTRTVKVVTFSTNHLQGFPYNFDSSEFPRVHETKKKVLRIKVKKELYIDPIGRERLNRLAGDLRAAHAFRDAYCDVITTFDIPGYKSHMITITRGDRPWFLKSWLYGLLCFFGFWFVYKIILQSSSAPFNAKVSKKASFDVPNPDDPNVPWQLTLE